MLDAPYGPRADWFSDLTRMQSLVDQVFRPKQRADIRASAGAAFPVINVGSTEGTVEVMALAPGLDPSKLDLTIDRGLLIIAGERPAAMPQGKDMNVYARERFAGAFRRVVQLPDDVDPGKIEATYRDGILRVTLSKQESSKPRRIQVN